MATKPKTGKMSIRPVYSAKAAKAAKEGSEEHVPDMRQQPGYDGELEEVDVTEYKLEITCSQPGCKAKRYIKPQDAFQVTMCKPHTVERQRADRAEKRREKRAASKGAAPVRKAAAVKPARAAKKATA